MARKSPRSRKKSTASSSRVPAAVRAPSSPRARARRLAAAAPERRAGHGGRARSAGPRARATAARTPSRRAPAKPAARAPARGRRVAPPTPERVAAILQILERTYPDAKCALDFSTPFQLLVATILSAQCTDVRVNLVTPGLFARHPDPAAMAAAGQEELEGEIRSTGFFRMKARALRECSADLVSKHGGQVPASLEALTALRGVGRKTANVVLGNACGIPGLVVDTHVGRVSRRLGLTTETDPVRVEFALMPIVPRERWTRFSHELILHGRRICVARKPRCSVCPLLPHCPRIGVTTSA